MIERAFDKGEIIVKEDAKGEYMFILLDGEVQVSKSLTLRSADHGLDQRDKSLSRLSSADHAFFGEIALMDENSTRTATVTTTKPSTIAIIKRDDFFHLAESDKEIGYVLVRNIARVLSNRLDKSNRDILKLTTALSLALEK